MESQGGQKQAKLTAFSATLSGLFMSYRNTKEMSDMDKFL